MAKFLITKSRFIRGEYIHATPELPAEIEVPEVPEGHKIDKGMTPLDEAAKVMAAKPPYVPNRRGAMPTAAEAAKQPAPTEAKKGSKGDKGDSPL